MTNNDIEGLGRRRVRQYSGDYIKDLVSLRTKEYDYKMLLLDDDTFNLGNKHTVAISKVLAETGMPWSALCRPDTVNNETWKIMKESNCFAVRLGFESGSQYVVDNIVNKRLDLNDAKAAVEYLKEIGLRSHGTFTIGHEGETTAQMEETMSYAKNIGLNSFQVSGVGIIEGSPLWRNAIKNTNSSVDQNTGDRADGDTVGHMLGSTMTYLNTV